MDKIIKITVSFVAVIAIFICSTAVYVSAEDSGDDNFNTEYVKKGICDINTYEKSVVGTSKYKTLGDLSFLKEDSITLHEKYIHDCFGESTMINGKEYFCEYYRKLKEKKNFYSFAHVGNDGSYVIYMCYTNAESVTISIREDGLYVNVVDAVSIINSDSGYWSIGGSIKDLPAFTVNSKLVMLYGNFSDTNGNQIYSSYPNTGDMFDKPVYTLAEYNKLLDSKDLTKYKLTIPAQKSLALSYYEADKLDGIGVKVSDKLGDSDTLRKNKYKACYNFLKKPPDAYKQSDYFYTRYYVVDKSLNAVVSEIYSDVPLQFKLNANYDNPVFPEANRAIVTMPYNDTYASTMIQQGDTQTRRFVSYLHLKNKTMYGEYFEKGGTISRLLEHGYVFVTIPSSVEKGEGDSNSQIGTNVTGKGDGTGDDGYEDLNGDESKDVIGDPVRPAKPSNPTDLLDWIGWFFNSVLWVIDYVVSQIQKIFIQLKGFWSIVRDLFFFFPVQVVDMLGLSILVSIIVGLFKR